MIRTAAKVICVLAGLFCLLAWADRRGWTRPLWARLLPEVILTRQPSASEVQIAELENRIETLKREVFSTKELRAAGSTKRRELLSQLCEQVGDPGEQRFSLESLMQGNPLVSALVRSVDALDQKDAELQRKTIDQQAELKRLEARLVSLRNGLRFVEAATDMTPPDGMETENDGSTAFERYDRIIREAMSKSDR